MLTRCHIRKCPDYATQRLLFTSGMQASYCNKHAAIFHPEMIEDREQIDYTHTEEYRQFLADTVDDTEYTAYIEHRQTPRASDY